MTNPENQTEIQDAMETQRVIETIVILTEAYRNLRGRKRATEHRDQALDKLEELINQLTQPITFTQEPTHG